MADDIEAEITARTMSDEEMTAFWAEMDRKREERMEAERTAIAGPFQGTGVYRAGSVGVDSGLIMVGDPCYTLPDDAGTQPYYRNCNIPELKADWHKFCDRLGPSESPRGVYAPFTPNPDTAVVVQTAYGDGGYPVYVKRNHEGRIMALIVDFGLEEDDRTIEIPKDEDLEEHMEIVHQLLPPTLPPGV